MALGQLLQDFYVLSTFDFFNEEYLIELPSNNVTFSYIRYIGNPEVNGLEVSPTSDILVSSEDL